MTYKKVTINKSGTNGETIMSCIWILMQGGVDWDIK